MTSELTVFLKDADLVATTAFLTLTGTMGYGATLLGVKRFDYFRFIMRLEEDPVGAVDRLVRVLSSQSTFYNRNKHHYNLASHWEGGDAFRGTDLETVRRRLALDAANSLANKADRKISIQPGSKEAIFNGDTVFLAKLLVQERDDTRKNALAARLQGELAVPSVDFTDTGVVWWLALRSRDSMEAGRLLEEMAVTVKRDTGLLVNPHYQDHALLSVAELELNNV